MHPISPAEKEENQRGCRPQSSLSQKPASVRKKLKNFTDTGEKEIIFNLRYQIGLKLCSEVHEISVSPTCEL